MGKPTKEEARQALIERMADVEPEPPVLVEPQNA